MDKCKFKIYVTGHTPQSERAIANLHRLCTHLKMDYELRIVDVLEDPQQAERDQIIATPTLIKALPPPLRRLVGDLSNDDRIVIGLDLIPQTDKG